MKWQRTNWTDDEIAQLVSLWGTMPSWKIGQRMNRPAASIKNKAHRLNLPRISEDIRQTFCRSTCAQKPVPIIERDVPEDEESQHWCAYWLARREARLARCGGHAWSA